MQWLCVYLSACEYACSSGMVCICFLRPASGDLHWRGEEILLYFFLSVSCPLLSSGKQQRPQSNMWEIQTDVFLCTRSHWRVFVSHNYYYAVRNPSPSHHLTSTWTWSCGQSQDTECVGHHILACYNFVVCGKFQDSRVCTCCGDLCRTDSASL